jgi:signal transduction histidine kinase
MSANQRSDPLLGTSLPQAIERLLTDFHLAHGIEPSIQIELPSKLSPEIATNIYRIVQEALTNVAKHATADRIEVKILSSPTTIDLAIVDNGNGFDPSKNTTGFGLQGMEERVKSIGGRFQVIASLDRGCQILAHIPLTLDNLTKEIQN